LKVLIEEADKTRWWLQEQNLWATSNVQTPVRSQDDETQLKMMTLYPLVDDPSVPPNEQETSLFLGFNGVVYILTAVGLQAIESDEFLRPDDAEYIIDTLRLNRGE
jgi:hypothetical protein